MVFCWEQISGYYAIGRNLTIAFLVLLQMGSQPGDGLAFPSLQLTAFSIVPTWLRRVQLHNSDASAVSA